MRGVLGSIVDRLAGRGRSPARLELERHFVALDGVRQGMAREVADFVATGDGGAVLAGLSAPAVLAAWSGQVRSYPRQGPNTGLIQADQDAALRRYDEAMALLEPAPPNSHWGAFGTTIAPDWLRHAVSTGQAEPVCSTGRLAAIAAAGGASPAAVLDILFHPGPGVPYGTQASIAWFGDAGGWLRDHVEPVRRHHAELDAAGRVELAHALGRLGLAEPYLALLVGYGLSTARTVRAAARTALTGAPRDALAAALREAWGTANPGTRAELAALAVGTLGREAGPLLAAWRATETERRPGEALDRALAAVALDAGAAPAAGPSDRAYPALDGSTVTLPPPPTVPGASAIPREVYALLQPSIDSYNARLLGLQQEHRGDGQRHWSRSWARIEARDLAAFRDAIEAGGTIERHQERRTSLAALQWPNAFIKVDRAGVAAFYAHPAVTLRHLIALLRREVGWTLLALLGEGVEHAAAQELRHRLATPADFEAACALWVEMGGAAPAREYLRHTWQSPLAHPARDLLWIHVASAFDAIDEALGLRPQSEPQPLHAGAALELLETLPKVPARYLLALMTIATGSQKAPRQQARALLDGAPDIDAAIERLLGDGRQETRAGAAEWLAGRQARAALPALRQALGRERSEIVRAAIITTRERLGDDVADCFDAGRLLAEAEKGLAKTSAKGLDWFPFDLLPAVSWQEGSIVDPRVVRWWVVLAGKLRQPGSNALLDLWLARLRPEDARALGRVALRAWIEQDTARAGEDAANAYAAGLVDGILQQQRQAVQRYPAHAAYYVTDRDQLFAQLKRGKLAEYLGSASDSKGVLALATRAEGADAAAAVRAFLKDHGARIAQGKALLEMLAANPAPAAIQVVLATANRFKARTVQDHAAALVGRIAEARGWTPEELADRTIPSAGLDESGAAELDCGEGRTYRLVLDAADALVLLNPAGKPAKALPAPREEAEKPVMAEARKQLAAARKELKQAFAAQTERLYEAMCLERRWQAGDWGEHLLRHPIVQRLLRRLVWIGLDAAGGRVLFRPLDDGSLSDVADGAVALESLREVQLAHASLVAPDEAEAWRAHLADYEVRPPFAQFEPDLPHLTAALAEATCIDDRHGWMIETFRLRGAAAKLGFVRGAAEDGGVFTTYERRFEAAGLVALVGFTGSPLPEENLPAALHDLRFARLRRGSGWHGAGVPLNEVPRVLLAESWQALHRIAAAGTGFDADWEKKAGW